MLKQATWGDRQIDGANGDRQIDGANGYRSIYKIRYNDGANGNPQIYLYICKLIELQKY